MDSQPTIPMDLAPAPPQLTQAPPPPAPPSPQPPSTSTAIVTTEQIPNYSAQAANPTPTSNPAPNHPPYAEMITSAVAALKEKNGSTKSAIAKYIDEVYTNLPTTHSTLLAHHLKRLKTNGQLIAVKNSFKLPPSPRSAPLVEEEDNLVISPTVSSSAQPKKRPGRPPKLKPIPQVSDNGPSYPTQAQPQPFVTGPGETYNITSGPTQNLYNVAIGPTPISQRRKPGRPPKLKPVVPPPAQAQAQTQTIAGPPPGAAHYVVVPTPAQAQAHNSTLPPPAALSNGGAVFGSEAVFVSLGLSDGPAAAVGTPSGRRRGRPRKVDSAGPQQPKPPKPLNHIGVKRKPGRPAKNELGVNGVAHVGSVSGRPRGRPKRVAPAVINGPVHVQPKKRGRKPKNVVPPAAMFVHHGETSAAAVPGAVMVPYAPVPDTAVPGNGFAALAGRKRRGRPSKAAGAAASVPKPKKPRRFSGKPLGRPKKKNVSPPDSSDQSAAYLEMKGKFEYLQKRVRETVSVLRPCIENGLPPSALGVLEQLEELVTEAATDDAAAAVNVQDQQLVQHHQV